MKNNLKMIKKLHMNDINFDTTQRIITLANIAAICENISIIKYFHNNEINFCEVHEYNWKFYVDTFLYCATSRDHFNIIHFFLNLKTLFDKINHNHINYSFFETALIFEKNEYIWVISETHIRFCDCKFFNCRHSK